MVDRRDSEIRRKHHERREAARLPTAATSIRFLRAGALADEVLPAELIDVSPGGVSIQLDRPLIRGECIAIEIRDADKHCFNLSAQAMWVETDCDNQHRAGCELRVELTRKQYLLLRELVAQPREA